MSKVEPTSFKNLKHPELQQRHREECSRQARETVWSWIGLIPYLRPRAADFVQVGRLAVLQTQEGCAVLHLPWHLVNETAERAWSIEFWREQRWP